MVFILSDVIIIELVGLMFYLSKNILGKFLNNHAVDTNVEIIAIEFHQIK